MRDAIISPQNLAPQLVTRPTISANNDNSAASATSEQVNRQQKADGVLRAALEAMRAQRLVVQQGVPQGASQEQIALRQGAAARVQGLENEVDQALQSTPEVKVTKLARLKERFAKTQGPQGTPGLNKGPSISIMPRRIGQE